MNKCPYCSAIIQEDAQFCLYCMKSLKDKETVPHKKRQTKGIAILTVASVLLATVLFSSVGIAFYFFVSGNNGTNTQNETTESTSKKTSKNSEENEKADKFESTAVTDADTKEKKPTLTEKVQNEEKTDTQQSISSGYTDAKESEAQKKPLCAEGHTWKAVTKTVHHEETGHYENTLIGYKTVTTYKCALCYKPPFDTLELYYEHFSTHIHYDGDPAGMLLERYEVITEDVPVYDEKWVVDTPAYDEEIIIGYVCSVCKKEK